MAFVHPNTSSALVELFESHNLPSAPLLAAFWYGVLDQVGPDQERVLEHVARELRPYAGDSIEAVLLRASWIYLDSVRHGLRGHDVSTEVVGRIAGHLTRVSKDFSFEFRAAIASSRPFFDLVFVSALLEHDLIDISRLLDVEALRTTTKFLDGVSTDQGARNRDPSVPDYWFLVDPSRTLRACLALFRREPIETLGALAWGAERALELRYIRGDHPELSNDLQELALALVSRRMTERAEGDRLLTQCCWPYAQVVATDAPRLLGLDYPALREHSLASLGRLRGEIRSQGAAALSQSNQRFLNAGFFFVLRTDESSLWDVVRRLLLAFRELPQQAVAPDLRTWNEAGLEPVPQPWGWIPSQIANVLELMIGRELTIDPHLERLRRNFGEFCLDRLKSRTTVDSSKPVTDADLTEHDPIWREGYLLALKELHSTLGERGQRALIWVENNDPSPTVQSEAKKAHESMRRDHGLPKDASPRRAMFAAFWWLRQAHVLALKGTPDPNGAARTYRKEARRPGQEATF